MEDFDKEECRTYVVHFKKYNHDLYIGRPSKWANPYTYKDLDKTQAKYQVDSRKEAIEGYERHLKESGLIKDIDELRGKVLGCWCCNKPSDGSEKNFLCHGQVIAKYLNSELKNKQKQLI
jgi:hypothetical protein